MLVMLQKNERKQKKIPTCLHGARDGAAGGCGGAAVLVIEVTGSSSYENEINVSNVTKKTKKTPTRLHGDRDDAAGGCGGAAALVIEVTRSRSYKNEKKLVMLQKKKENQKKTHIIAWGQRRCRWWPRWHGCPHYSNYRE